jgi:glycosyltransferase involved in cell wall biosynthesis
MRKALKSVSGDVLYIIIPAYNESENIIRVIEGWYPVVEKHNGDGMSRLVVIDDGSTDNTYDILREIANARPLMEVIPRENHGHGPTVLFGYRYALKKGADYIFQTDSDGQTVPSEFSPFWRRREKYDMLVGLRKNREDGKGRVFLAKVLRQIIFSVFGVRCPDANTPFRLMKAGPLAKCLNAIPENAELSNALLTVKYEKSGCAVRYLPITFRSRQGGTDALNRSRRFAIIRRSLGEFRRVKKEWEK